MNPPWNPSDEQRERVKMLCAFGVTQEEIAKAMGVCVDTLAKHCREELDLGAMEANEKVGKFLFQQATGGSVPAAMFWAKTRMRWRETSDEPQGGDTVVRIVGGLPDAV